MNVLIREETERRSTLRMEFSDRAVESLAAPLNLVLTGQANRRSSGPPGAVDVPRALASPTGPSDSDGSPATTPSNAGEDEPSRQSPATGASVGLKDVFHQDGETLKLDLIYLGAANKADYTKRLTYLFLLAQHEAGRDLVPRSELIRIWKQAGVNDGNARKFLIRDGNLEIAGNQVRILAGARRQAGNFLQDLSDAGESDGWYPGKASQRRRARGGSGARRPASGSETDGREQMRPETGAKREPIDSQVERWSAAWRRAPLVSNPHKIFSNRSTFEQALFGLWVIRKLANGENPVVSTNALARFLVATFELEVTESGLRAALKRSRGKEVLRRGGVQFQITETGMEYVEGILGSGPVS